MTVALGGLTTVALPAFAAGTVRARITSTVHDAAHFDISDTLVPAGTEIHVNVSLAASRGKPLPSGTVDFYRYVNTTCSGTPAATESDVALVNGTAESALYATTGQALSLRAHYDGDAIYNTGDSQCEIMNAGVLSVSMMIHDAAHNDVSATTLAVGSVIHVQATLTSTGANQPTGTVDFKFWSGTSICPGHANSTQKRVVLVSGQAESRPYTMLDAGSYSYKIVYPGDANNSSIVGPCVFVNAG
jgi:hypothetical protein